MDKTILYVIIATLSGVIAGIFISAYAVNNQKTGMMNMMGIRSGSIYQCPMENN